MKKVILFALLIAAAATSAFAHQEPQMWKIYSCSYDNYSGPALTNPSGLSWWEKRPGSSTGLIYTYEHFKKANGTWDAYKANWAKPVTDSYGFTTWEFTFAGGTQCKRVVITPGGFTISFSQCGDGHTRYCWTQ